MKDSYAPRCPDCGRKGEIEGHQTCQYPGLRLGVPTLVRETTMFYVFEVRDSDGNDCTVFDALVEAKTFELASSRLWRHLAECYPDDESDGGYGTFHACDCKCDHGRPPFDCEHCAETWECSPHGGLLTNEDDVPAPLVFATEAEARAHLAYYHSLIELVEVDNDGRHARRRGSCVGRGR